MATVPLGPPSHTLACGRLAVVGRECGRTATWHIFWYPAEGVPFINGRDNSLACDEHTEDARGRWSTSFGLRHPVSAACGMPGSRVRVAHHGEDQDGMPLT